MIQIEFRPKEIGQLYYERYHHPHPLVQQKMEVLYLKSQRLSYQEIGRLCNTTVATYLKQYQQDGIEELKQLNYQGQPSVLNLHSDTIKAYFKKRCSSPH